MAWNGSDHQPTSCARANAPRALRTFSRRRGFFAALLFVVLVGAALWFFFLRSPTPDSNSNSLAARSPARIVEQKPAPARTNKVAKAEIAKPKTPEPTLVPPKPYRDESGKLWEAPDRPYRDPNAIKVVYADRTEPLEKIFPRTCDIRIAQLLSIEPGESVEMPVFGKTFNQDFQESLFEEVRVSADDDEYTRNMKEAVADVRKELISRTKQGEDPAQVMTEAWRELYLLGQYKSDLQANLVEMSRQGGVVAEDAEKIVDAADRMLEEKGLPAFKNRRFISRMLQLNAIRNKEEAQ